MNNNKDPNNDVPSSSLLPADVWRSFAHHYLIVAGMSLCAYRIEGASRVEFFSRSEPCPLASMNDARCAAFYDKAVSQLSRADEPMLFRCHEGLLLFGLGFSVQGKDLELVIFGGPVRPLDIESTKTIANRVIELPLNGRAAQFHKLPKMGPSRLLDFANLAKLSFESLVKGNAAREDYFHRQAQLMTLFEVASDLSQSSTGFDMHALALNTLGVLFDVGCAAVMLVDPLGKRLRVHSAMGEMEKSILPWSASIDDPDIVELLTPKANCRLDDSHLFGKLGLPEEVERLHVFPLTDGSRTTGLLLVVNNDLSPEVQQIIRGFAINLSSAIENKRLREELEAKNSELEAIQRIGLNFSSCLDRETLFPRILEEAVNITGASKASLMISSEKKGCLKVMAVSGGGEKIVSKLLVRDGEGIAGQVFVSGKPLLVDDVESDLRFARKNRSRYSTKSFLSVPILTHDNVVGVLNLADKFSGGIFTSRDLRVINTIAGHATLAIERSAYYHRSLMLRKISITDPLTGLVNRRYFQERLTDEIERALRGGHPLSMLMIDIDFFKEYNDANGHPAGDRALVLAARTLRGNMRSIDLVSRFGGEEFAVILPETRKTEALEIGERIRAEVEMICFPGEENLKKGKLTISLGVAEFPEDSQDIKSLVRRADKALYKAKNAGRNRIEAYSSENAVRPSESISPVWTKVL